MVSKCIKTVLLIMFLSTQVADSFAMSSPGCDMQNDMHEQHLIDNEHNSSQNSHETNQMDADCCGDGCACPLGIVSIAMLVNFDILTPIEFKSLKPNTFITDADDAVLGRMQRPPKRSIA